MHGIFYRVWATLIILLTVALLLSSCAKGVMGPVNEGREYGNPKLPLVVSHLPRNNQWVLNRTDKHFFLAHILCFDYVCRKMIGRNKALHTISFEKAQKQIRKNAKKGLYNRPPPPVRPAEPDTVPQTTESAPVPVTVPEVVAPILKADSLITLSEFLFETNSYALDANHYASLDSIAQFLVAHPALVVNISGHTDNRGTERYNFELSERRAKAVTDYLIVSGNVRNRITYDGFGSARPIISNDTEAGRSKNRRVEILIRNP